MNTDRRILSWLAILLSLFCCAPLALGAGFISLAGFISYIDSQSTWGRSDSMIFGAFFGIAVLVLLAGLLSAAWGVTSLLKGDTGVVQEISRTDQNIKVE